MGKLKRDSDKQKFWQRMVSEQAHSGLSVRAFCRREGLGEANFYYWRRALVRRSVGRSEPEQASFVEVKSPAGEPQPARRVADSSVQVLLPGGAVVGVQTGFDASLLRQVVEALS